MELLLTPGEIEQRAKDTLVGEKKVAITSKRMDAWQQKQKTDLQEQYNLVVKKIQLAILKKKNQVELSKYRLKSKESLADFDTYQEKLLATKISKLDIKRDREKFKHDLKVEKLQRLSDSKVNLLKQNSAKAIAKLAAKQDLTTILANINTCYDLKVKTAQLEKESRLIVIKNHHDKNLAGLNVSKLRGLKVNQEKLASLKARGADSTIIESKQQELDQINAKFLQNSQALEEQTKTKIAKVEADYQKKLKVYSAKKQRLSTQAEQKNYDGFAQKKNAIETKFQTRIEKTQNRSSRLINSLDKKLTQTNQKHDAKVEAVKTSHREKATKARNNFLAKTPLSEAKLKQLQLTNNAIINDLKDYQVSQVGKYEHQIDLLTQNLNQGMLDIDDGVKASIEQAKKTNIDKIDQKYAKKNFKANYQKETIKLMEENQWDQQSAHQLLVNLYDDSDKSYTPASILATEFYQGQKTRVWNWWLSVRIKYARCREWSWKEWINLKIWGMPVYVYAVLFGIMAAVLATDKAEANMLYPSFILFTIAIIGGTIFNKIPIWNKYLGGAVMGCLFIGAFLVYLDVIPKNGEVYKSVNAWFSGQKFLDFYISVILIAAVLIVPRKILLKALGGFIIILAIGSLAGAGTGILGGLIVGFEPKKTIISYLFPVLGGGTGAGVVPMSQVIRDNWGQSTGDTWQSKAMAFTTIANIFSILIAAILAGLGRAKPELSGEGNLSKSNIHVIEDKIQLKDRNIAASLVALLGIYVFSTIISNQILTKERIHVTLPNYAWMIVICLVLNFTNLVPSDMKAGMGKIQTFMSKQTTWLVMLAIGILNINLKDFVSALTGQTFLIILLICLGATLVPMLLARLFMFYPIEAGITAGCCMTAQGGAGVIGVLGASNRVQLMPYGQISARIGGSVVLIIASIILSSWNPATYA